MNENFNYNLGGVNENISYDVRIGLQEPILNENVNYNLGRVNENVSYYLVEEDIKEEKRSMDESMVEEDEINRRVNSG